MYELPEGKLINFSKFPKFWKGQLFKVVILSILISSLCGFLAGALSGAYFWTTAQDFFQKFNIELPHYLVAKPGSEGPQKPQAPYVSQEAAIIQAVKEVSPSVVSIIITKDLPVFEEYYINPFKDFEQFFGPQFPESPFEIPQRRQKGTEKKEIGGGTGFIISEDGMVLTNKHVVLDESADYTILTNEGDKYPAKVLARDPVKDLAILKIDTKQAVKFKPIKLGDSKSLQIGQSVIAIGNALGEFRNTVSVGVISGLRRTISASGAGTIERLSNLIQTDAAINPGNSGGPLLNLKGEVIGVNVAMGSMAQNIGFAIPINEVKMDVKTVKARGKIVYPFLGVRYIMITDKIQKERDLPVDYGAWVTSWSKEMGGWKKTKQFAIIPGSAAEKAGLKDGDIILEVDGQRITPENPLVKVIMEYNPGARIKLKILRNKQEKIIEAVLGERTG